MSACRSRPPRAEGVLLLDRRYLTVPYPERDAAKAAGLRWDKERKAWYGEGELGALPEHWFGEPRKAKAEPERGSVEMGNRLIDWEVNQVLQYAQCKSHPSIPKDSASEPGSAWKNGFFSMGSHCSAPT